MATIRQASTRAAAGAARLQRFIDAQDSPYWQSSSTTYERALLELKQGQKRGHWIWFIFPQLDGLGMSRQSSIYSLKGVHEAVLYLRHKELRRRYIAAMEAVQSVSKRKELEEILQSRVDTVKFISSLTLFQGTSRWMAEHSESLHLGASESEEITTVNELCTMLIDTATQQGFKPCSFTASRLEIFNLKETDATV